MGPDHPPLPGGPPGGQYAGGMQPRPGGVPFPGGAPPGMSQPAPPGMFPLRGPPGGPPFGQPGPPSGPRPGVPPPFAPGFAPGMPGPGMAPLGRPPSGPASQGQLMPVGPGAPANGLPRPPMFPPGGMPPPASAPGMPLAQPLPRPLPVPPPMGQRPGALLPPVQPRPGFPPAGTPPMPPPPGVPQPFQPGVPPPGAQAFSHGIAPPGPQGFPQGVPPPGSMLPPPGQLPPPGAPGGGMDPYGAQRLQEQFEALAIAPGVGPGGTDAVDPQALPRPIADAREQALAPANYPPELADFNCAPHNMRMTVAAIPNSAALRSRWALPLGTIVQPMADENVGRVVPKLDLGASGIVRCRRCRTYMNPFMQWVDGGRRFKCNVCSMLNDIPADYYSPVDHTGRRHDLPQRPELASGTVEYVAPDEYMVRPPMPPAYFFVIDVSFASVASGMLATVTAAIRDCLDNLAGDERTRVGFLTFDNTLHFYSLKPSQSAPQMMVVTELDEPFVPQADDLLVNLRDSRERVEALLSCLPATFAANQASDSATGPALQAAMMVMTMGGKLLLFQSGPPTLGAGKAKTAAENLTLYGTDREPQLRNPEDQFYKRFATECSRQQISVDVFAFSTQHMDLASLAAISRYTCGQVYYYPGFSAPRDAPKLTAEVTRNLTRPTAWEAVMRIRCSAGLRIAAFHGHFFNRSTDLLALPHCDPDKSFAVEITHEENVLQGHVAYVQCALLYTSSTGERRIRVHTMAVPVVSELSELYRALDGAAAMTLVARLGVEKSLASRLDETRTALQQRVVQSLKEFRMLHAGTFRAANQLIFPPALRHVPLWALGALKSPALRGGAKDVTADERIAVGHDMMATALPQLLMLLYPTLYMLLPGPDDWGTKDEAGRVRLPPELPLSLQHCNGSGAYLLDNGRFLVLWLGRTLSPAWVADAFGLEPNAVPADVSVLTMEGATRSTPLADRLKALLKALRAGRPLYQQLFVVRQDTAMQVHVLPYFVEDKTATTYSYTEFVGVLNKGVLSK